MSSLALKACVLLAVTLHVEGQYADFFQSFNAFLQPFTTARPRHEATKRPDTKHKQTNKHKYDDVIFFPADDRDLYGHVNTGTHSSTSKKSTKSSHNEHTTSRPKSKPLNSNKLINNLNSHVIRSVGNNNEHAYNNIDHNNQASASNKANSKQALYLRPQSQYPENNNRGIHGTTLNPLLNRPGVKPAVVDENKPPITNRPVTQRPVYDLPFDQYRPANTRPPYEIERPKPGYNDPNAYDKRPSNTRPSYDTERPVTSRPVTSSNVADEEPDIEIGPDEDEMSEVQKRRYYETCEQKCSEYKSTHTRKVVALPLAGSQRAEVNVTSCARNTAPLIIGGQLADIRGFPHMALVGWRKIQSSGYSWKCGGSLVSEQYILTAGHCTYYDKDDKIVSGPPHAVQLGSSMMDGRDSTVIQVLTIIRHPKYKLRRSYYDVAIIRLKHTVSFSETIRPACLGVPPPVGESIIATGWGKTEFGGDSSIELRSVSLPIWDMTECKEIWGTSRKLPQGPMEDNQLCAGERRGAKDTCQGDSGGPAQIQDGCSWRIVAVTSLGRSCGAPETPALYAKIPRAFIASQVYTNAKTNGGNGNNNRGNTNNNGGSGNNNAGTTNNNRGVENAWGSINNHRGSESNTGIRNDNWGSGNNNGGSANNNWGSTTSGINNVGITSNNWGSANNNQANRNAATIKPIQNNGRPSNQRSGRRNDSSNNNNHEQTAVNHNSQNEYNNPISYGNSFEQNNRNTNFGPQNYYNNDRPSDYNRYDNIYNNPVNPSWWNR